MLSLANGHFKITTSLRGFFPSGLLQRTRWGVGAEDGGGGAPASCTVLQFKHKVIPSPPPLPSVIRPGLRQRGTWRGRVVLQVVEVVVNVQAAVGHRDAGEPVRLPRVVEVVMAGRGRVHRVPGMDPEGPQPRVGDRRAVIPRAVAGVPSIGVPARGEVAHVQGPRPERAARALVDRRHDVVCDA